MFLRNRGVRGAICFAGLTLAACGEAPAQVETSTVPNGRAEAPCSAVSEPPAMGLVTSLPLYWPLGADISTLASGSVAMPWQREAIEQCVRIVPLDTLSSIAPLAPDGEEIDPLADLDRLAVIQPRGLSPADNVALDRWVRAGGHLLLVLDPMLTGEYDLPLGDPSRPIDSALIAPVVRHWGLAMSVDDHETFEDGIFDVPLAKGNLTVAHPGNLRIVDPEAASCELLGQGVVARCKVGMGRVTLLADAATFEHQEAAGRGGRSLMRVLAYAFD